MEQFQAEMNTQTVKKIAKPFNTRTFSDNLIPPPLSESLEKSRFPASRFREFSLVEFDKRGPWKSITPPI